MGDEFRRFPVPKTLWTYIREGLRKANARRPVSFYLLLSIPVVLLLGAQIAGMRDNPKRFAFYLTLLFVFFFVILQRAIVDLFDIARTHFRERQKLFRTTLGENDFVTRLGERVNERRED